MSLLTRMVLTIFFLVTFLSSTLNASTPSKYEQEPNDLAVNATVFRGETVLHGILIPKDTDHFLWKVSKKDTLRNWEMSLSPLPSGNITVSLSKVSFQKAGLSTVSFSKNAKELKSKTKIFSFKNDNKHTVSTLHPLVVEKGIYLVTVSASSPTPYKVSFTKKEKIYGRIGKSQKDARNTYINGQYLYSSKEKDAWFSFKIPKKESNKVWQISSSVTLGASQNMSIVDEHNEILAKVSASSYGKMFVEDLELKEGIYYVHYTHAKDKHYAVEIKSTGTQTIDKYEVEPNNSKQEANTIRLSKVIHGSLAQAKDSRDFFSFKIPSDFQHKAFDITVKSDDIALKVSLLDANTVLQSKAVDSNYTFTHLSLQAKKRYFLEIYKYSKDANYSISFSKPYALKSTSDIEPNDTPKIAPYIEHNQSISGYFMGDETDCVVFNVERNNRFWSMHTQGATTKRMYLYHNNIEILRTTEKVNDSLRFEHLFLAKGSYALCLKGKNGSYKISISHKNMKELNISSLDNFEHEPNQNSAQANPLHFNHSKKGLLETKSNEDFFYFTLKNEEHIRLKATPPKDREVRIKLMGEHLTQRAYPKEGEVSVIEGVYPAGRYVVDLFTQKPSFDTYTLTLERLNPFRTKAVEHNHSNAQPLNATVKLDLKQSNPRSYYHLGQIVDFDVIVYNERNTSQTLFLSSHSSDKHWNIHCPQESITLLSEETKTMACQVNIPKNVSQDEVVISLKISNQTDIFVSSSITFSPKDEISVEKSYKDWGIPKAFLGSLNVSRVDLGARRVLEHNETSLGYVPKIGKYYHYLFDDIVYDGSYGFYLYSGRKTVDENVTVKLLGNVEIIGVALNLKGYNNANTFLKDFSIWLSSDGINYNKVHSGSLRKTFEEQHFMFAKSHKARYAKLTLHNNQEGEPLGEITLGEWKVLAKQTSINPSVPFNLANPELGGHIVSASKPLSSHWDNYLLTEKSDVGAIYLNKNETQLTWILGFKNERMAKLTHIVWDEALKSKRESRLPNVRLYISKQTPTGPWEEIGVWDRNTTLDSNSSNYVFSQPTWARYVKFSMDIKKSKRTYYPPETLKVYEEKPSHTYKSILGEWGKDNHESYYEYLQSQKELNPATITGNEEKSTAYTLEENTSIQGEVSVAKHQKDWYKITVPKGQNKLTLTLANKESVDVSYLLYDTNNTVVKAESFEQLPQKHSMVFAVEEGVYYLNIHQPPINVVFAWDNSGSVSPYKRQIAAAVNAYVDQIEENIDSVNLLCFNVANKFVLSDFSNQKEEIQTMFHDFSWGCNSSDAEVSLSVATQALEKKEGIKGVIIIADADGSRDENLWQSLNKVRPKVFSIRVASSYDSRVYEGLMQNWSRVNNGSYAVVENATQMSKAINHAAHVLRRPVFYDVHIKTEYIRPLDDGSLRIIQPKSTKQEKAKTDKGFAIELILDASGSMLKRIKGKRRIDIAKDVLIKAVQEIIPPHTQVALRVFGHKKADSCRTDLEMRLQPLNVKKTSNIIKRIKAKNLAKTPIAASLAKVATDLKSVKGKRVIILVTDGKETCDGNATQEIEKLKALGIEVKLNIVGFAIDNAKLKQEFETWAKLGNGAYFEANDKKSLDEAVKKALQIPYTVWTLEGKQLYNGMVGDDGLKLKGGTYKVVVESYPKCVYDEVVVIGEAETVLNISNKMKDK